MLLGALKTSEAILFSVTTFLSFIAASSASLALYVYLKRAKRRSGDDLDWTGHGFDATGVAPRLRAVRRDFLNEVQSRGYIAGHSQERIAGARKLVARLSYFAVGQTTEDLQEQDPSSPALDTRHPSASA